MGILDKTSFEKHVKLDELKGAVNIFCGETRWDISSLVWAHQTAGLTTYEQWRIYLVRKRYAEAKKYFQSIQDNDNNYWYAQFQLGRIEQIENPNNDFRTSRLYWRSIPKQSEVYWDAQYALGNLWEKYHGCYKKVPVWHRRYHDAIFKLWCIAAISEKGNIAAKYFHALPSYYPNSKDFQRLFPLQENTRK